MNQRRILPRIGSREIKTQTKTEIKVENVFFLLILSVLTTQTHALEVSVTVALIQKIEAQYGPFAGKRLLAWQTLLENHTYKQELEKLEAVNQFFNQMQFVRDLANWGAKDYWATPVEFLAKGGGDCEDFSIAKYYTLLALKIPDEKMQLTYVKALSLNESHMVLTYYSDTQAIPLVLDNIEPKILPATERRDLIPVYSFNGSGLWEAKERGRGRKLGRASELRRWKDVTQKMLKTFKRGLQ